MELKARCVSQCYIFSFKMYLIFKANLNYFSDMTIATVLPSGVSIPASHLVLESLFLAFADTPSPLPISFESSLKVELSSLTSVSM